MESLMLFLPFSSLQGGSTPIGPLGGQLSGLLVLCRPMPDIDTLMQEWTPEFEELLGKV